MSQGLATLPTVLSSDHRDYIPALRLKGIDELLEIPTFLCNACRAKIGVYNIISGIEGLSKGMIAFKSM